ncbi:hypothetical protein TA3x_003992 [Tundrisphaera sp. TA3]|uniref:hypothetical protein n=1 Tax=Tundrisphaera sp. TA3 TaxID=3435775 RepID=UPI003EBB5790
MTQPERTRTPIVLAAWLALAMGAGVAVAADLEAVAADSLLVQPAGPRPGEAGKTYANVQGPKAGSDPKFAGFAILDFPAPKLASADEKVRKATLTLTQSVARFSRDGRIRLFLAGESGGKLDDAGKPLRFDPKAPGGLGDQIPGLIPLGLADYAKGGTGDADPYPIALDDAARKALDDRLRAGGTIRIVIAPEDAHVAATFFGVGARQPENRPRLTIVTGP